MTVAPAFIGLEVVLGRPEWQFDLEELAARVPSHKTLLTGASGSIGQGLLEWSGFIAVDKELGQDLADMEVCSHYLRGVDTVIHCAGAKSAPDGELDPLDSVRNNVVVTRNLSSLCRDRGIRLVTVSTCKAANPETVYGASKLLAERMTLGVGGAVARLYNVVETRDNVFEKWGRLEPGEPIPVTGCTRFFISLQEALGLVLSVARREPGRFTIGGVVDRSMREVARDLYPGRGITPIAPRRGDRLAEPRCAFPSERIVGDGPVVEIRSVHD